MRKLSVVISVLALGTLVVAAGFRVADLSFSAESDNDVAVTGDLVAYDGLRRLLTIATIRGEEQIRVTDASMVVRGVTTLPEAALENAVGLNVKVRYRWTNDEKIARHIRLSSAQVLAR